MSFRFPLILLAALPAVAIFFLVGRKKGEAVHVTGTAASFTTQGTLLLGMVPWLRIIAVLLLVTALAQPQLVREERHLVRDGVDIVLAVDVSKSMELRDFSAAGSPRTRLDATREVIADFIARRRDDGIGIALFAGDAWGVGPPTLDHAWLAGHVASLRATAVDDGTSVGAGILAALDLLRPGRPGRKVIVLLTDGRDNSSRYSHLAAARAAAALGVRIYTVGIGDGETVLLPVTDPFGSTTYRRVAASVDEQALRAIAATGGGRFYRVRREVSDLQAVYREIDRLEKTRIIEKARSRDDELYHLPLAAAAGLLLLLVVIRAFHPRIP